MKESTKKLLYTLLDILEILRRDEYLNDLDEYTIVKKEIIHLIHPITDEKVNEKNVIENLIGILPSTLIDKDKFPSNKDLVKFSEFSFNIKVPSWEKKKREEIIGRIVYAIAETNPKELLKFTEGWNEFNRVDESKAETSKLKTNYVDMWLSFFEKYNNLNYAKE
ncbi:hypothetical protein [Capnocytophaga leadbetteri]|uniref:hypothetical protein n=1 Tax=Capnocytophaga leadbetteri TaxID=327575 RepID=UPI0028E7712C|nr:hypothetical protein [Capnocytophaga leadbetteri]